MSQGEWPKKKRKEPGDNVSKNSGAQDENVPIFNVPDPDELQRIEESHRKAIIDKFNKIRELEERLANQKGSEFEQERARRESEFWPEEIEIPAVQEESSESEDEIPTVIPIVENEDESDSEDDIPTVIPEDQYGTTDFLDSTPAPHAQDFIELVANAKTDPSQMTPKAEILGITEEQQINYSSIIEEYHIPQSGIEGPPPENFKDSMDSLIAASQPMMEMTQTPDQKLTIGSKDASGVPTQFMGHKIYEGMPEDRQDNVRKILTYEGIQHEAPEMTVLTPDFKFSQVNNRREAYKIFNTELLINGKVHIITDLASMEGGFSRTFFAYEKGPDGEPDMDKQPLFIKFVDTGLFGAQDHSESTRDIILHWTWQEIGIMMDLHNGPEGPIGGVPQIMGVVPLTEDDEIITPSEQEDQDQHHQKSYFVHTRKDGDKVYLDKVVIPHKAIIAMTYEGGGENLNSGLGAIELEELKQSRISKIMELIDSGDKEAEQALENYNRMIEMMETGIIQSMQGNRPELIPAFEKSLDKAHHKENVILEYAPKDLIQVYQDHFNEKVGKLKDKSGIQDLEFYHSKLQGIVQNAIYRHPTTRQNPDIISQFRQDAQVMPIDQAILKNTPASEAGKKRLQQDLQKLMEDRNTYGEIGTKIFGEMRGPLQEEVDVLGKVHKRGYVHKDIKPANLLMGSVIDFGLAMEMVEIPDARYTMASNISNDMHSILQFLAQEYPEDFQVHDYFAPGGQGEKSEQSIFEYMQLPVEEQSHQGLVDLVASEFESVGFDSGYASYLANDYLFAYRERPEELRRRGFSEIPYSHNHNYYAYEYFLNGNNEAAWLTLSNESNFEDYRRVGGSYEYMHPHLLFTKSPMFYNRIASLSHVNNALAAHMADVEDSRPREFVVDNPEYLELYIEFYNSVLQDNPDLSSQERDRLEWKKGQIERELQLYHDGQQSGSVMIDHDDAVQSYDYFSQKHLDMELVEKRVVLAKKSYDIYAMILTIDDIMSNILLGSKRSKIMRESVRDYIDLWNPVIMDELLTRRKTDGSPVLPLGVAKYLKVANIISGDISSITNEELPPFEELFQEIMDSFQNMKPEDWVYLRAQKDALDRCLKEDYIIRHSDGTEEEFDSFMTRAKKDHEKDVPYLEKRNLFQDNVEDFERRLKKERSKLAMLYEGGQ